MKGVAKRPKGTKGTPHYLLDAKMPLEKKSFRKYSLETQTDAPVSVKLSKRDEEMIEIGKYAFNMDSTGGVLKELARLGLENVILNGLGIDRWHYLTRGDRVRVIRTRPKLHHYNQKGNTHSSMD